MAGRMLPLLPLAAWGALAGSSPPHLSSSGSQQHLIVVDLVMHAVGHAGRQLPELRRDHLRHKMIVLFTGTSLTRCLHRICFLAHCLHRFTAPTDHGLVSHS